MADYTISSIAQIKSIIESKNIQNLIGVACVGKFIAFISTFFYPIVFERPKNQTPLVHILKGETNSQPPCTCVDISPDQKYLVVGHADGSISLWSLINNTLLKQYKYLHSSSITAISFGHNSDTIFVGDQSGIASWIRISSFFSILSFNEIILYEGDTPVQQFCFTKSVSNFEIGFIVYELRFITIDPKCLGSTSKKDVQASIVNSSITYLDTPYIQLVETGSFTPYVSVAAGQKFYYYQCTPDHRLEFKNGFNISDGYIDYCIPISPYLSAFISKTGYLSLTTITGKEIFKTNDPTLQSIRGVASSNESLIIITDKDSYIVTFMPFTVRLFSIAEKEHNWEAAFQAGEDIFLNRPTDLIGIPSNLAHRRSIVQDLMEKIMTRYCQLLIENNEPNETLIPILQSLVLHCIKIEETEFIVTKLFEQFKIANKLTPFFEAIFSSELSVDSLGICTADFVSAYINHAAHPNQIYIPPSEPQNQDNSEEDQNQQPSESDKQNDENINQNSDIALNSENTENSGNTGNNEKTENNEKIDQDQEKKDEEEIDVESLKRAEDILLHLDFEKGQARTIIQVAYKYKMYRLTLYLLEKYIKDYILVCSVALEAGPQYLLDVINRVFFTNRDKFEDSTRKTIVIWTFIPEHDQFQRLEALIRADIAKSPLIIREFLDSLPISYTFSSSLTFEAAFDALMRVTEHFETSEIMGLLEEICPIISMQNELLTGVGIQKIIEWIFLSDKDTLQRQTVLTLITEQYPGLIPDEDLVAYSMQCGFVNCILDSLLPQKAYTQIFGTALLSPDFNDLVFQIIEENIQEDKRLLKDAVQSNFNALLLTNPKMTVSTVDEYFPELKQEMANLPLLEKWLFLKEVVENNPLHDDLLSLFELICTFEPESAITFLNDHSSEMSAEDIKKASKIAETHGRVDCSIEILKQSNDYDGAVKVIAKEVRESILTFEETVDKCNINSIDELADNKEIQQSFKTVRIAIDLLNNVSNSNVFKQWDSVYRSFQLPLYHMQKISQAKPGVAQAVSILFSYFVVESLNALPTDVVFLVLSTYFIMLNSNQYRSLLKTIFSRIDYQDKLYSTVEQLLMNDCLELVEKAFIKTTRGLQSDANVCCHACQQPLSKGTTPFYIFPCGHCFHKQAECGFPEKEQQSKDQQNDNGLVIAQSAKVKDSLALKCPICTGGKSSISGIGGSEVGKMSTRRIQQLMRRMEFSLRKNYGNKKEENSSGVGNYFAKKDFDDGENMVAFTILGFPNKTISVKTKEEVDQQ